MSIVYLLFLGTKLRDFVCNWFAILIRRFCNWFAILILCLNTEILHTVLTIKRLKWEQEMYLIASLALILNFEF